MDDWFLVRTQDAKAGWVLARMLNVAVPDEIAQYAEGHRITGYLPLGNVKDKSGEVKTNYLWTTIAKGLQPYQFDSFRVFVWSLSRHRYETAYIERNVRGYYPVLPVAGLDSAAFSLILETRDGSLVRKTYAFSGYRVRLVKQEAYQKPAVEEFEQPAPAPVTVTEKTPTWRERLHHLFRR
jgi:hypothetical protein